MALEETPSLTGQRGTRLDLGPQIQRGDAQDRLPTSGTASLAWLEEAPPRWCRPSLSSPKATSENMSRRIREDTAVRRELEMLEEKMMRQVLRLQEQSERFMDIMMHPLEAKVAALEGRQPVIDCSIAELRGNLKGIQESMEIQVRRSDQSETRMCHWRKTLEEELQSRMSEGPAPSDTVGRSEMVDLAKVLKKELKKLVEESFRDGHVVSQKELTALGSALREELGSVEQLAAETAAAKLQGHQELMGAAEAVRAEMKTLTEKAIQEEALVRASMSALQELEKASDRSKGALETLDRRMARCEFDVKELRTARAQVAGVAAAPAAAEAEAAPAQDPLLDELLQRMARFERLEEDLRADVDSPQGLLRALQETQRQHSQDAMKVDGVSEMAKQLSRCEEQIEELQTQLQVLPSSSLAVSDREVTLPPDFTDFTERLQKCERQNQEFQKQLHGQSSLNSEIARCEEQVKELRLLHEKSSAEDPQATAMGEMSLQIRRCEQQVKELQEELREEKSSKPQVSAFNPHEDEDLTDHQLMLLDLQQRVSSLEGPGELVASSPQSGVLGQAAELIQKIELDLQQARAAVVPGLDMTPTIQEASERGMVPELPTHQLPSLPPLAAMKVMASPRLQRLSMTPRLQELSAQCVEAAADRVVAFATGEESSSLAFDASLSELRTEVAAVWDAIAELAEIVGDAAPHGAVRYSQSSSLGPAGDLLQAASLAKEKAETFQGDLRRVEAAVQELNSRMNGCERRLREAGNKEDLFATLDVSSFKVPPQEPEPKPAADVAPSRLARAFGDLPAVPMKGRMKGRPSDASSSHATVSDAGEARGETT